MREAIVKELVGAVKEIAGSGYSVTAQETTKNNGVKMLGIEIRKPEETVVPRLYVDGIVDRVEDGFMTVEDAAKKVFETYQNSETPEIEMNVEKWIDRKFILDHVEYQLVNAERNAEKLKDTWTMRTASLNRYSKARKDRKAMEVKIISGFGENVFQMSEESVWDVLREASKQAKNSLKEEKDADKPQMENKADELEVEKPNEALQIPG